MNSKAIATMMAVIMAVVGFTIVFADGADGADGADEPITLDKVSVSSNEGDSNRIDDSTVVVVNEANYIHYDYTLTWTLSTGASGDVPIGTIVKSDVTTNPTLNVLYVKEDTVSDSNSLNDSNFSIQMVRDALTTGQYNLKITGLSATTGIDYTLKASIIVSINGIDKKIDNFAVYNGSVSVYSAATGGYISVTLEDKGAQVGKLYDRSISIQTGGMNIDDYDWYAVNLPSGLTMSIDGNVSGIPTVDIDESTKYSFRVFATDDAGNVFYGDIREFYIEPKPTPNAAGYTYTIDNKKAASQYIFEAGYNIVLKLETVGEAPEPITTGATVKAINTVDNSSTTIEIEYSAESGGYDLPSKGSGAYMVTIDYNKEILSFSVYIIGNAGSIDANIVISGA